MVMLWSGRRLVSTVLPSIQASSDGYRMCTRVYLNGEGVGRGTTTKSTGQFFFWAHVAMPLHEIMWYMYFQLPYSQEGMHMKAYTTMGAFHGWLPTCAIT